LDVAWQEWQVAVNARTAFYRVLALDAQVVRAREATNGLQGSTNAMREAVNAHEKTVLELAAVESASRLRRWPLCRKLEGRRRRSNPGRERIGHAPDCQQK